MRSELVAAQGAYDVDGVVDDAGAGVDYDGVSVVIAALIAVGNGCEFNDDLRWHGTEALLPTRWEHSVAVVLLAQAGRKIAWAVVIAYEVVVVLVAEVALILMLVVAVSVSVAVIVITVIVAATVPVAVPIPVSVAFVVIIVMSMTVTVFVVLRRGVGGWKEREGCCGGPCQERKLSSIQDVSFGEELWCEVLLHGYTVPAA